MLLTDKGKPDCTARQVLAVLGEHANEQGRNSYPSVLRIRFATGLDDRTIERALLRLLRGRLIERSGRTYNGTWRWNLAMDVVRAPSEWDELVAGAEAAKELESGRRKARRHRQSSGDGADVRDAECRTPGVSVRTSGTQSADIRDAESGIRDAEPPEPSEPSEPSGEPPDEPPNGGTLPPNPLRPQDPPTSGPGTDQANSHSEPGTQPQALARNSRPRAPADLGAVPPLHLVGRTRGMDVVAAAMARRAEARRAHHGDASTA